VGAAAGEDQCLGDLHAHTTSDATPFARGPGA
jgi:hypothetical protein